MKAIFAGVCAALLLSACAQNNNSQGTSQPRAPSAANSGPVGGNWSGTIAGTGPDAFCNGKIKMMVTDGHADGSYTIARSAPKPLTGAVDANGAFKSDNGTISGTFNGDTFSGGFPNTQSANYCGNFWRVQMSRDK